LGGLNSCHSQDNTISLECTWSFQLDSTDVGIQEEWVEKRLTESITLPGTTDDVALGIPNTVTLKLKKPQVLVNQTNPYEAKLELLMLNILNWKKVQRTGYICRLDNWNKHRRCSAP